MVIALDARALAASIDLNLICLTAALGQARLGSAWPRDILGAALRLRNQTIHPSIGPRHLSRRAPDAVAAAAAPYRASYVLRAQR